MRRMSISTGAKRLEAYKPSLITFRIWRAWGKAAGKKVGGKGAVQTQKRKGGPFLTGLFKLEVKNRQSLSPATVGIGG